MAPSNETNHLYILINIASSKVPFQHGADMQSKVEELHQLNQAMRDRDKLKDDAIAQIDTGRRLWLEGMRVNPNYRRRSVATQLLYKMISYGKKQGAREAYAMVVNNKIAVLIKFPEECFQHNQKIAIDKFL